FRERAVRKFAPLEQIHAWQDRIPVRKQFWAFVGLKLVSISAFDFVSYAAGLSRISFGTFLAATLIVDLPLTLAFFYLGGIAIRYSVILFIAFALILWIAAGGVFFRSYGSNREEKKSV
ncbi:MAG: VTT domain-containing protein, partial [Candidatus Sungbacteria bacterium]|nr:VTT domain-containing protein [Candidatus Sungbacteria bacterium]